MLEALLEPSWAVLEASPAVSRPSWTILGPSEAVMEASWTILAALVACRVRLGGHLGLFGRLGERQGGVLAAQGAPGVGGMHAAVCDERGGTLEDYRNPARQHLAFFHASTRRRGGEYWLYAGALLGR